jgi:hypothetical protein
MPRFNFPPELHFRQPLRQRVNVVLGGPADVCGLRPSVPPGVPYIDLMKFWYDFDGVGPR